MKFTLIVCLIATALIVYTEAQLAREEDEDFPYATADDEIEETIYDFQPPEYAQLPKQVVAKFGMISGIYAVNESHIYVFHRANRKWDIDSFGKDNVYAKQAEGPIKANTIALLINGEIKMEAGAGLFYMPHSISVDKEGNVWTTDVALHQVFKFKQDDLTKPALVLGEKFKPGSDDSHFCKPTDVKIASNGCFFVSDGYCNSRVLKFHPNGTLDKVLGSSFEMAVPHSLGLWEEKNLLYIADRENDRIITIDACLNKEDDCGLPVAERQLEGKVFALDVSPQTEKLFVFELADFVSYVRVMDAVNLIDEQLVYGPENKGFGYGHALSNMKLNDTENSGFVVASLFRDCSGIMCPADSIEVSSEIGQGEIYLVKDV